VGYFYTSGFYSIYKSLEKTDKIRILIGISTNYETVDLMQKAQSHNEIKEGFARTIKKEFEEEEDNKDVESGVYKFTEWLKSGKLEIKAYPEEKIHSKLYIMTFQDGDRDPGRVITGSSNFTKNGLSNNLEFNVELRNPEDYNFAKNKFEELWNNSIDVSQQYVETIKRDTWLRDDITPYQMYLKFLYEYFKEEIDYDELEGETPDGFKKLKYQEDAVIDAKKIVEEYGGVFISDVVGLGKTYMSTMLCRELRGKILVLAPPHLIDENNSGSWSNAFKDFGFKSKDYRCESVGVLEKIVEKNIYKDYDIILIDEAHRFRSEDTQSYTHLSKICKGKRVILVTATPYNNSPKDLLSVIKLFQKVNKSTIPNLSNLGGFFNGMSAELSKINRQTNRQEYLSKAKKYSKLVRERVLKYLMVRRTRQEIVQYYGDDLKNQDMSFPAVADPCPIYYEFNEDEDRVFTSTMEMIRKRTKKELVKYELEGGRSFKYSRYAPFLYSKDANIIKKDGTRQENMLGFMRMLLVKRLESSFFAFRQTVDRFIKSYENYISHYEQEGEVFISKKHSQKIFEYIDRGDLDAIARLEESGKATRHSIDDFNEQFKKDLDSDLQFLKDLKDNWSVVKRDPKLIKFKQSLQADEVLKNNKIIIFTESSETADYLAKELKQDYPKEVLSFTSSNSKSDREVVIDSFDAKSKNKVYNFRILVTTDVLSEGVNLHQSNVVINYDIPWNPTRIMQRVGRINRVDTEFKQIYTYTLFPTVQGNNELALEESANAKIAAFIKMLGVDSKLLSDDENIESHSLFNQILSKDSIDGGEQINSELKYLREIRNIKEQNPKLFGQIMRLPKKARTARVSPGSNSELLTYLRKGRLQKFYLASCNDFAPPVEIDFFKAAEMLSATANEKHTKLDSCFYDLMARNTEMLKTLSQNGITEVSNSRGNGNANKLLAIIKLPNIRQSQSLTEPRQEYIEKVIEEIESGGVSKGLLKIIMTEIEAEGEQAILNVDKFLAILKRNISDDYLQPTYSEQKSESKNSKKEVVLSEYFKSNK